MPPALGLLPWQAEKQSPSQQGVICPLSEIRVTTISNTAGTGAVTLTKQSANKGYLNFNGSGTPAVADSFNHSSITDGGTGIYACNFTNSMANANFGHTNGGDHSSAGINTNKYDSRAADTFNCRAYTYAGSLADNAYISLAFQGDIA